MRSEGERDPLMLALGRLPVPAPSGARNERVVARCHAMLARRSRMTIERGRPMLAICGETALAALLCGYAVLAALQAIRLIVVVH